MLLKQESITTEKLALWRIANSVREGKSAIPPLFNGPELLYSVSDKAKILLKTFLKTRILMTLVTLYLLSHLELI